MGIALHGLSDSSQGLRRRVPLFLFLDGTELWSPRTETEGTAPLQPLLTSFVSCLQVRRGPSRALEL